MSNRFSQFIVLCFGAILLCASISVFADEIQSINKLFKQGQHEQALSRVNAYLSGKPKDAQARFLKGLILAEQGKSDDAIRVFSGLTEDYPELPEPYNNLAVLYASQYQFDKARVALEMAIRTHPSYATAHENLGDIYAKMASQAYDRALQLDRNNTATQTKLALIKDLFSGTPKAGKPVTAPPSEVATTATAQLQSTEQTSVVPAAQPAAASAAAVVTAPTAPEKVVVAALEPASLPNKPATKESAENSEKEVTKAVHDWAVSWSSKDTKRYLAFYAKDFKTPGGESRSEWESQRRERIAGPKTITVTVKELRVKFIDNNHARATFRQSYRASHLHNVSSKILILVKSGGSWLIQEETTGK